MIHSPLLFPKEYNGLSELFKSNYANVYLVVYYINV